MVGCPSPLFAIVSDQLSPRPTHHHRGIEILKDEQLNKTAAAAVAISSLLPDALRQEVDGLEKLIRLADDWERFELQPIAGKINDEFQEMTSDGSNRFSFLRAFQNAAKRMNAH